MSQVFVADGNNYEALSHIRYRNVISNSHKKSLEDGSETFDFTTHADKPYSPYIEGNNRIIIPGEDGEFLEFIIYEVQEDRIERELEVYSFASYAELRTAKVIPEHTTSSLTVGQHAGIALDGTEWQIGIVESDAVRSITFESRTHPYGYLKRLASVFNLELHFRIEHDNGKMIGRYADLLERVGEWRGRRVEFGKDLLGLRRVENTDEIVTALNVIGPEDENGDRLEVVVEDEEAFQRWARNGKHIIKDYEPQFEMEENATEERLIELGEQELAKRVKAIVTYEGTIADLEKVPGLEHKKFRFGDTIQIKDTSYEPALYLDARIFFQDRDIKDQAEKQVRLGDFTEYTQEEVDAIWKSLEQQIKNKISMTDLTEVTYTKPEIEERDKPGNDAANKIETDVGWTEVIETEQGSQEKADQAEENANNHTDQIKQEIDQELLDKADLEYVDGQLQFKADSDVVETINNTVNDLESTTDQLLIDVANHADELQTQGGRITTVEYDLDEVEGQLSLAITDLELLENEVSTQGTQISANAEAISFKAEASVVEGLQDEFNALSIGGRNILENTKEIILEPTQTSSNYHPFFFHNATEQGKEYTFSSNVEVTDGTVDEINIRVRKSNGDYSQSFVIPIIDERIEHTYVADVDEGRIYAYAGVGGSTEGNGVIFRETKLEKGNKATDWTPAPEDVEADINGVETRVTDLSADLDIVAGQIEAKAERSALENLEDDVTSISNEVGSLSVAYDGISADVSSLQTTTSDHTSDISDLNAQLDIQAGQISSKVDATFVEGAIADIEVGGRNLASTSALSDSSADRDGFKYTLTKTSSSGNPNIRISSDIFNIGERYILSFKIRKISGTIVKLNGHCTWFTDIAVYIDRNRTSGHWSGGNNPYPDDNETHNVEVHLTYREHPTSGNSNLYIQPNRPEYDDNFVADIWDIQVERGNKATDWTPAPEDVQSEIDSVYSYAESEFNQLAGQIELKADSEYVDDVETRVANAEVDINGLEGEIELRVKESVYNDDISDINSEINQRAREYNVDIPMSSSDDYVILLCRSDLTGQENFVIGTLSGRRTSGHYSVGEVKVVFNNNTDGTTPSGYFEAIDVQYTNSWTMVTCEYEGNEYVALRHQPSSTFGIWNNSPKFYGQIGSSTSSNMLVGMNTSDVSNVQEFDSVGNVSSPILRAESSITQLSNQIELKVEENDVRSIFTQEADSFTFEASQINFDGHVFGGDATFTGTIEGAVIEGSRFISDGSESHVEINENGEIVATGKTATESEGTELTVSAGLITFEYEKSQRSMRLNHSGLLMTNEHGTVRLLEVDGDGDFVQDGFNGTQKIVSVVSQGENADGRWIRYSDGRQEVWCTPQSTTTTISSGNIYRSDSQYIDFPINFDTSYPIAVNVNVTSTTRWGDITGPPDAGGVNVRQYSYSSSSSYLSAYVYAVGRWR
ncbi:phage tail spike protein [Gracilibacillus lacisalsi]|uniref:phage tail spike protein n=1 Tax=Gracilibacillus lacisalsi TaxID=393087 RepID=UPI00037228E3|nr:phage tail spike protein [Gracilibacillus lacisalsi]